MDYFNPYARDNVRLARRAVIEYVVVDRPLNRILRFTGFSIDNVVDNRFAKHAVLGYYKLYKQINRRCEVIDLERQWNSTAAP
jgi:hypothetical protein